MTYLTATNSNLRKAAFRNTRTILLNNVTSVGTRVYGAYPETKIVLPLIILENANKQPREVKTLTGNEGRYVIQNIVLYGKQAELMDSMADQVEALIEAAIDTCSNYNITLPEDFIEDLGTSGPFDDISGNRIYSKVLAIKLILD